ncbi:MAG: hypothetical protein DIU61_012240 [Bacteroidota bacterium]|jgi:predicted lysophospholipase L1 biosynthesis ABC-type transport system permease subunit|nr:MAG: hypothetical protein DIU61_08590 [Bacteroidota bacterium]
MKEIPEYEKDIASIRTMMERSVKFISLSGLSGILAGVYAIAGAVVAWQLVYYPRSPFSYRIETLQAKSALTWLVITAACVLVASLGTGLWLSQRKAKKHGMNLWNVTTKTLVINLAIPLITGGLFILILLQSGHYGIAAPACLIFYGLALINASANLYDEVRYLGYSEIVLGLIAAYLAGYGLLFWTLGFGVLHIIYGAVMYYRYDK